MIADGWYKLSILEPKSLPGFDRKVAVAKRSGHYLREFSGPYLSPRDNSVEVRGGKAQFVTVDALRDFMIPFVKHSVFEHVIDHLDWPSNAEYKIQYRVRAWPTEGDTHTKFFENKEHLDEFIRDQREWARSEGNSFTIEAIWGWDLGPFLIE